MECGQVREKLSCYLDGVLDEAMYEAIDSHLEHCVECRKELEALRSVVGLVSDLFEVEPPASLSSAIRNAVTKEQKLAGSCAYYRAMMSEYVDGELSADDEAEIESHVALCDHCSRELVALKTTVESLAAIGEVDPPASLRGRIAAATTGKKHVGIVTLVKSRIAALTLVPRLGWAAGAAAVIAFAAWLAIPRQTDEQLAAKVDPNPSAAITEITPEPIPVAEPIPVEVDAKTALKSAVYRVTSSPREPVKTAASALETAVIRAEEKHKTPTYEDATQVATAPVEEVESRPVDEVEIELAESSVIDEKANEDEATAVADQPQPKFMRIGHKPNINTQDIEDYFKDVKSDAQMKRKSGNRFRVDIITKQF